MSQFGWGSLYEEVSNDITKHDAISKMKAHTVFYRLLLKRASNKVQYKMQVIMSEVVK